MTRSRLVPDTMYDLTLIIAAEMAEHGNACSLNHVDISNISYLDTLFQNSPFDGDISQWDTSHVESMGYMFDASAFTGKQGSIAGWNVEQCFDFQGMFYRSAFHGDLSPWSISRYVEKDGFNLFATNNTSKDLGDLALPMQGHSPIAAIFYNDPERMNRWLGAQATKAPLSRYHWDALVANIASGDWASPELVQYAKQLCPVFEGLGIDCMQTAETLRQRWEERVRAGHEGTTLGQECVSLGGLV